MFCCCMIFSFSKRYISLFELKKRESKTKVYIDKSKNFLTVYFLCFENDNSVLTKFSRYVITDEISNYCFISKKNFAYDYDWYCRGIMSLRKKSC